ncbi:MAG: hypothetical protein HYU73_06350 [Betaproteobacteria bacterium]|nr:hypothetical protein [Betaproteobacteria bacterium]
MNDSASHRDLRLEVHEHPVTDIVFGKQTVLEGTRLTVCVTDLKVIAHQEDALADIDVAVARPGESVRIIHALDAVEAMAKVAGPGTVYPGFLGPAVTVGRGTTKKLTGMLVLSTTEFPDATSGGLGYRDGIIDMTGPGRPYCQASNSINLVVSFKPRSGVTNQQLDDAVRRSTLRVAQLIGQTSAKLAPAKTAADRIHRSDHEPDVDDADFYLWTTTRGCPADFDSPQRTDRWGDSFRQLQESAEGRDLPPQQQAVDEGAVSTSWRGSEFCRHCGQPGPSGHL